MSRRVWWLVRRARRLSPVAIDRIAAAALTLGAVLEVLMSPDRSGPPLANAGVAIVYSAPFAWRRRSPPAVAGIVFLGAITMAELLTPIDDLFIPLLVILLTAYSCGAYRDGLEANASVLLIAASMVTVITTMADQSAGDYFFPIAFMVLAWLMGRLVRSRTRLTEVLHEDAARAAEHHEAQLRGAAAEERRRLARELHDLVAHSMSVMVVQAGGARRILDRDPARALEAAARIERTGREALAEMRHLLGVLHDEPRALAPQPMLAQLEELLARARGAGLDAVLFELGERRPLATGVDLAAYRIVQEALTNALKHAGGARTEVTIGWGERELGIEIRDHGAGDEAGRGSGHGHGLIGMRERVRVYGGELQTSVPPDGGWLVRATLPLQREPAPV